MTQPRKLMTAFFVFQSSTKGAHRYQEVNRLGQPLDMRDTECAIGALYIRKQAMPEPFATLTVEVKVGGD